jgi:hypothetical protein
MASLPAELQPVFERFIRQPGELRQALADADGGIIGRMIPGTDWTVRDVIMHLGEHEQVFGIQVRLILAQDGPTLPVPDYATWKRRLQYVWRDPDAALSLFEQLRWSNAEMMEHLRGEHWTRTGLLGEERVTVGDLLARCEEHVAERIERVGDARSARR